MSIFDNAASEFGTLAAAIGNRLVAALPSDWRNLWVQVEMDMQTASIAVFYVTTDQPKPLFLQPIPDALFDDFRELQEAARRIDAQNVWSTAAFMLSCDGECHVEYGYEPIPIEAELQRRRAWKNKYLSPPA